MKANFDYLVRPGEIPLDIRSDPVFKAVFTRDIPEAKGALSNLVSALTGRKMAVISILANEQPVNGLGDRKLRYDIKCRTEDGELINIEMGLNPRTYETLRMEFHAGRLFTTQEISGKEKTYRHLKETYQISILAEKKFFKDDIFFHTFEYYDAVNRISLNGKTRIISLELCKLEEIAEKPVGEMSASERWAVYFEYLTDEGKRGKINEIVKSEEGIAMASSVLMTISRDEEERFRLLDEESQLMTYYSDLEEGREEEREKAKQREKTAVRNLLARGMPVEEIAQIMELSLDKVLEYCK